MNSCDFCVESYDFAPVDDDYELKHFDSNVKHDQAEMIPLMRAAKQAVNKRGQEFKLFASPWSPPAWLKAPNSIPPMRPTITFDHNRSMLGSAHPLGLRNSPEAFAAWALYYSKFAEAYDRQNLTLWGFTVQNEPEFSAPCDAASFVFPRDLASMASLRFGVASMASSVTPSMRRSQRVAVVAEGHALYITQVGGLPLERVVDDGFC